MAQTKKRKKAAVNKARFGRDRIAFLLVAVGCVMIVASNLYFVYKQNTLWFGHAPKRSAIELSQRQANQPIRIKIDSLSISLPITEGYIENNRWDVSENGVSHLNISAYPQTPGNIILYGHNKTSILGKLVNIKQGATITLKTRDQKEYSYKVEKTLVVSPSNVEILESHNKEIITLYTCTGFADLKRFVVVAKPIITPSIKK